jgi:hypothetical protein
LTLVKHYHGVIDNKGTTESLTSANFNLIDTKTDYEPAEIKINGLFYDINAKEFPKCLDNLLSYFYTPTNNDGKWKSYYSRNINSVLTNSDRCLYYNPRYDNEEHALKIFQKYNIDIGLLSSPSANLAKSITGKVYRRIPQFNTTENIFTNNESIITRLYTFNKI